VKGRAHPGFSIFVYECAKPAPNFTPSSRRFTINSSECCSSIANSPSLLSLEQRSAFFFWVLKNSGSSMEPGTRIYIQLRHTSTNSGSYLSLRNPEEIVIWNWFDPRTYCQHALRILLALNAYRNTLADNCPESSWQLMAQKLCEGAPVK
jgi:hypothetical protein